jgi:nitrogenase subunit NifH
MYKIAIYGKGGIGKSTTCMQPFRGTQCDGVSCDPNRL